MLVNVCLKTAELCQVLELYSQDMESLQESRTLFPRHGELKRSSPAHLGAGFQDQGEEWDILVILASNTVGKDGLTEDLRKLNLVSSFKERVDDHIRFCINALTE